MAHTITQQNPKVLYGDNNDDPSTIPTPDQLASLLVTTDADGGSGKIYAALPVGFEGAPEWAPVGGGGGSNVFVPNRRNHSVNGASVENFSGAFPLPVMRTNTNVNNPGAYNGGGTGNKAMLGHRLDAPLPLSALLSIQLDFERITFEDPFPLVVPYMNLLCEFDPANNPGVISILSLGDPGNPLNQGTTVPIGLPGSHQFRTTWSPAANLIQVVLDKGLGPPFAAPPTPLFGPATVPFTPPGLPPPAAWPGRAYAVSDLLIAYPAAQIVNFNSGDGGLPKATETAGVIISLGDSGTFKQNSVRILAWLLNGVSI